MWNTIKNNKIIVFLIIVLPLLVGIGVKIIDYIPFLNKIPGDNGDWIGFWASYLGTIVAILVAVWVAKHESKSNKKEIDHLNKLQNETVHNLGEISRTQIEITKIFDDFRKNYMNNFVEQKKIETTLTINEHIIDNINKSEKRIEICLNQIGTYNEDLFQFRRISFKGLGDEFSYHQQLVQQSSIQFLFSIDNVLRSVIYVSEILELIGIEEGTSYNSSLTSLNTSLEKLKLLPYDIIDGLRPIIDFNDNTRLVEIIDEYKAVVTNTENSLRLFKNTNSVVNKKLIENLPYKNHQ